ncbi:NADAR family protein [Mucilaginibacter mali]|uniref:NADAR family protein n=1 Tax=Mucilaginibacter mali TaxID=2740462 RepID=A0A7D4TXI4_9SPHI|nr:NADAR family protein [Mucilaginibacter mali]QKJ32395.1 NADAR family protein [Mucilaginibacter mali]
MHQYNLQWLFNRYDSGEPLKFLFFWGHSNKTNDKVGKFCFSQWYELPFVVDDISYKTTEHWMMANKALLFDDTQTYHKIINAVKPGEVKELGRQVCGFDEIIWNRERYNIVVKGNIHKFNQHPQFAQYLINTANRILVEASLVDKIWGIGLAQDAENINNPHFWNGQNLLGFALMEARDLLKEYGHFSAVISPVAIPWKAHPEIHPYDMFWQMGDGESLAMRFWAWYDELDLREQLIFKLTNPVPYVWREIFDFNE